MNRPPINLPPMNRAMCVPPAPEVISMLYMEYLRVGKPVGITFAQYLATVGYTNPAHDLSGMDDATQWQMSPAGLERIAIPRNPITGEVRVKVLLIDFPDREGTRDRQHYEDLLFSRSVHPTGSMSDYFQEVSLGQVDVQGTVHGWVRLPQAYSYYTNGESGIRGGWASYPHNAQRMAEDAVNAALQMGVTFEPELDFLQSGVVTALILIHAGRGAETQDRRIAPNEIWSHKWEMQNLIQVAPGLFATTYLTLPHDCKLGVCAHEFGHLVMQWQDFYDSNAAEDGVEWGGTGYWDLMAAGSYNGNSLTPAHPAALHKMQHGWIEVQTLNFAQGAPADVQVELPPYTPTSGKVVKVISPRYGNRQYFLLENRARRNFDTYLPGEGLLVWRVDERGEMLAPVKPGLLLVQADALRQLETLPHHRGDAGDPFPGSTRRTRLSPSGVINTSFPGGNPSGITFSAIRQVQSTGAMTLRVQYDGS